MSPITYPFGCSPCREGGLPRLGRLEGTGQHRTAPDSALIAAGLVAIGLVPITTDISTERRHLPIAQANVLQAVLFTSFPWELGFHAWAPLFIFPVALGQALIFTRTKSLSYIVSVHLLFDFVLSWF